jgi:hypothetical protein
MIPSKQLNPPSASVHCSGPTTLVVHAQAAAMQAQVGVP